MKNKIVLSCGKCLSRNYPIHKSGHATERIEIKKFCKVCNEHTTHRETR